MGRKLKAFKDLVDSQIELIPLEQIKKAVFHLRHGEPHPSLVQSVKEFGGVIEPIVVRIDKENPELYEIVTGWNRFNSCLEVNRIREHKVISTIPARVIEATDREALMITMTENLARKNLHWIEEGIGYLIFKQMQNIKENGIDQQQVWQKPLVNATGKNKSTIWRIVKATTYILELWNQEINAEALQRLKPWIFGIPMMAAQKLAQTNLSGDDSKQILEDLVTGDLTVAELDAAIKKVSTGKSETIEEAVTSVKEDEEFKELIHTTIEEPEVSVPEPASVDDAESDDRESMDDDAAELKKIKDTITQIETKPEEKQHLLIKSLSLIIGMLENRTLFCPAHPEKNESLAFDCGLEIQEALKRIQED